FQLIEMVVEEMIGALDDLVVDPNVALITQLLHQFGNRLVGHDVVPVTLNHQTGGGAGSQEAEIVDIGRRRDANEPRDFWPAHQKLHADPRAERKSGNPAGRSIRVVSLKPIQRRGGVTELALPAIKFALAAADSANVEPQDRESTVG